MLKPLFFSLRANSSSTFPEPCPHPRQRNWSSWCGTGSCIRRGGWSQPIESRRINSNNLIRTSEADWVSRRSHHDPGVGLSLPKDGWKRAIDAVKGTRLAICKLGNVAHCHPRLPRGEASSSKQPRAPQLMRVRGPVSWTAPAGGKYTSTTQRWGRAGASNAGKRIAAHASQTAEPQWDALALPVRALPSNQTTPAGPLGKGLDGGMALMPVPEAKRGLVTLVQTQPGWPGHTDRPRPQIRRRWTV